MQLEHGAPGGVQSVTRCPVYRDTHNETHYHSSHTTSVRDNVLFMASYVRKNRSLLGSSIVS